MKEEWKPLKGFEQYYLISNKGNVYSIRRNRLLKGYYIGGHSIQTKKYFKERHWYLGVSLCVKCKEIRLLIHRLVAEHFIPNPENKPFVNHKDGIKDHNEYTNLEWVTSSENVKHAYDNNLAEVYPNENTRIAFELNNELRKKPIIDIKSNIKFNSIREAYISLNISKTAVRKSLKEDKDIYQGKYHFKYL